MTLFRLLDLIRRPDWLDRERAIAWGSVLLAMQLLLLVFIGLWQHGLFVAMAKPTSSDFVSFYAAGKLALAGTPALAYDQAAHHVAQSAATEPGAPYQFFFYPPVFLILCSALAAMPYPLAFAVFELTTLLLFVLIMRAVLRESGAGWVAPMLAFPPVFWTLGLGQNSFLTAALFGGFTLLVDRRPIGAGMLLGLLCYKPHFGLLAPVALLAGQRWRVMLAAAVSVGGLVLLSGVLFGWETWAAYLAAFAGSKAVYGSGRIDYAGMITLFGAARLLGFGNEPAYLLQCVMAALMALLVVLIWRRIASLPLRAASLLTATLLAVPMALLYDKMLALVAVGWLLREARQSGFLSWEKAVLVLIYPLALLTWSIGTAWHIPLGPEISFAVLVLCLRRVWRALSERGAGKGMTLGLPSWSPSPR
jgi:hypothetical protein